MHASKKLTMIITLAALSLSSAWAADEILAETKRVDGLNGLNVVPPVLTPKTDATLTLRLALDSQASPTRTATGEALAQTTPNPWKMKIKEPKNQTVSTKNIRLYLGQSFANGQPIATLCDNAIEIDEFDCVDETGEVPGGNDTPTYQGPVELTDFLFEGQQTEIFNIDGAPTIAGIELSNDTDIVFLDNNDDAFQLQPTKNALKLIRTLIKRGLIYAVVNSKFKATVENSKIIGYEPEDGFELQDVGINGDGEVRGTLHLK